MIHININTERIKFTIVIKFHKTFIKIPQIICNFSQMMLCNISEGASSCGAHITANTGDSVQYAE